MVLNVFFLKSPISGENFPQLGAGFVFCGLTVYQQMLLFPNGLVQMTVLIFICTLHPSAPATPKNNHNITGECFFVHTYPVLICIHWVFCIFW
ncbi:hypothetical protein PISMIDRAFT_378967 [Pisolithus microcarpus 441]|uniref:Uncharacterized protein n=1 Tax=Pisolithus microcarpus 441 TaxID=765257 RepID=A0A0C9YIX1_9AGAM|nr:hypothetical protein PISMIDRAFT_378967 [Pisolithus microcarpus 441]